MPVKAILAHGVGGVVDLGRGAAGLGRPELFGMLLGNRGQLADQMGSAQRVCGAIAVIDGEGVVHHGARVCRQDGEVVDRDPAAAFVQVVGGEQVGARHVQPLLAPGDVHRCLIDPDHRGQGD